MNGFAPLDGPKIAVLLCRRSHRPAEAAKKIAAPAQQHQSGRIGGENLYSDYGYELDGVEYATIDEALEASR